MKRKEFKKQTYVSPSIEVIKTEADCPLLIGSKMNGGHTKAGDDAELNAKQSFFDEFEEEDEEEDTSQPWGLQ